MSSLFQNIVNSYTFPILFVISGAYADSKPVKIHNGIFPNKGPRRGSTHLPNGKILMFLYISYVLLALFLEIHPLIYFR